MSSLDQLEQRLYDLSEDHTTAEIRCALTALRGAYDDATAAHSDCAPHFTDEELRAFLEEAV